MRDPYEVLGVPKSADEATIKKAYRKLAKQHSSGCNKNDPRSKERFAELNSAYEIVGDKDKRRQFDAGEIGADGKQRFTRLRRLWRRCRWRLPSGRRPTE